MEAILAILFSPQTIVFCLAIYLAVLVCRRLVEFIARKTAKLIPDKWESVWIYAWSDLILPAAPVILGGVVAFFVKQYPYPEVVAGSDLARVSFGLVAGFSSAYVYRAFKVLLEKFLSQKTASIKVDLVAGSNPPDPIKLEEPTKNVEVKVDVSAKVPEKEIPKA